MCLFRYESTIAGELTVEDHAVPARFQHVLSPSSCITNWERTGDNVWPVVGGGSSCKTPNTVERKFYEYCYKVDALVC